MTMTITAPTARPPRARATARIPAQRERERVARHIRAAEEVAATRDVTSLGPLQRRVRALLLQELARYRARGVFPRNRGFAEATPSFVDAEGTRCAMAHLLEVGGEATLVERIAKERNHAWVRELADEPRLLAWLAAAGLTVAEAAAIQPSYCATNSSCVCGGSFPHVGYPVPARGVVEGVVIEPSEGGRPLVRIDAVHGDVGGYAVGDTFVAAAYASQAGARVLAPVGASSHGGDAGTTALPAVVLDGEGVYTCRPIDGDPRPVTRELFLDAVQSSDCAGTLAAADPIWARDSCDRGSAGGCAVGTGGTASDAPTTLGVLLAIVTALAARRALGPKRRPSARARR